MARSWPAVDIRPVSDLLQAALIDYDTSAIHERAPDHWRVFFSSIGERDRALATLRVDFPRIAIQPIDVADEDWAARSQASLRAVRAGKIVVAPPWDVPPSPSDPLDEPSPGDVVILIQPSMGFGTGHHATTRLCLIALQRLDLRRGSVIDVGTGSAVLAIAASILGAEAVTGIDDDPDAIASARENLRLNRAATVQLQVGDVRTAPLQRADVVVANLTGGLLIDAASTLQRMVGPNGCLIVSGLMVEEEADVLEAFPSWHVEHREAEDEWLCLALRE